MKKAIIIISILLLITLIVSIIMYREKLSNLIPDMTNSKLPTGDINKELTATDLAFRKQFDETDGQKAIEYIQGAYGKGLATTIEKMLRLETAHFKSKQYKLTGSAGMEVGGWQDIPKDSVVGHFVIKDNHDGHLGKFIVWNSPTDFAVYLAEYIKRHEGNFARWNSTNKAKQISYANEVDKIKTHFVV